MGTHIRWQQSFSNDQQAQKQGLIKQRWMRQQAGSAIDRCLEAGNDDLCG